MQITIPDTLPCDIEKLSRDAGFDSVAEYVQSLIHQASDLAAIREGLEQAEHGEVMPLEEFKKAFIAEHGMPESE